MKWPFYRGGLRFCLVLIALAARESTVLSVALGIPLVLLGVALHVWAKGCLRQNQEVTIDGPYRFVRHPFYTANALVDAATAIMSGWWLLVALLPFWWLAIYLPVIRQEETYLAGAFPSSYPAYKRRVPALLPLRKPLPKTGPGFSWSNPNIACGKELSRALHLLAYPLLFYIWTELCADGGSFFVDHHCLKLWVLSILIVLYGLAWQLERHLKQCQPILPPVLAKPAFRIAAAVAFLGVATGITHLETELDHILIPVATIFFACSLLGYLRQEKDTLVGECLALIGVAIACELLWLTAVPILFYAALLMDRRLTKRIQPEALITQSPVLIRAVGSIPYYLILVGGLLGSVLKEIVSG